MQKVLCERRKIIIVLYSLYRSRSRVFIKGQARQTYIPFGLLSRGTFFDWEKPHAQGLENALFMGLVVHNLNYYDIGV
jgi:hypothetical protein